MSAKRSETVADLFFAHPNENVRGWEKAIDAQRRIVGAIKEVLDRSVDCGGDVAVVAHGGVDALTRQIRHGWRAIDG